MALKSGMGRAITSHFNLSIKARSSRLTESARKIAAVYRARIVYGGIKERPRGLHKLPLLSSLPSSFFWEWPLHHVSHAADNGGKCPNFAAAGKTPKSGNNQPPTARITAGDYQRVTHA
jgi:hypothetical protein